MPTLAELILALITDQPLSRDEKYEVALHVLRLVRRSREKQQPATRSPLEVTVRSAIICRRNPSSQRSVADSLRENAT